MRILIVDDQQRTRRSLRLLLDTLPSHVDVREAENGLEAVRLVTEIQPHIVVMDARMPKMDGPEATRLIKASWPEIKIIMLSMYPEYQEIALQAGADAFVSKGQNPDELLKVICALPGTNQSSGDR